MRVEDEPDTKGLSKLSPTLIAVITTHDRRTDGVHGPGRGKLKNSHVRAGIWTSFCEDDMIAVNLHVTIGQKKVTWGYKEKSNNTDK